MSILLSHTTALEALRSPLARRRLNRGERCAAEAPDEPPAPEELDALFERLPSLTRPIHVSVSERSRRADSSQVHTHTTKLQLPPDSAIRLAEGIYCSSPEHVVVEMSRMLTHLELVFLLGELLGTYAIAPGTEEGMAKRPHPVTDPERILAHLAALGSVSGVARVRRALRVACVGSASPQETRLSMRLGLKPALGGYHLDVLSMNKPVEVIRIGRELGEGVRKPDVLLRAPRADAPFSGVAFDYEGNVHRRPGRRTVDLRRQNELLAVNFKDYLLDKVLYDDLDYMDDLVRRIRDDLGIAQPRLGYAEEARRRALRQWLHDELELIDGVTWAGRLRERDRRRAPLEELACHQVPEPVYDPVPVEAYDLD